jgi:hypothetical protein
MRIEIYPNFHKILKVSKTDDPQLLAQQFTLDHGLNPSSIKFLTQKIVEQTMVYGQKPKQPSQAQNPPRPIPEKKKF